MRCCSRPTLPFSRDPPFIWKTSLCCPLADGKEKTWDWSDDPATWLVPTTFVENGGWVKGVLRKAEFIVWNGKKDSKVWRFDIDAIKSLGHLEFDRVKFSPDGNWVASGGNFGIITLWNLKTGAIRPLGRCSSEIYGIDFTRDSKTLVAAGGYDIRMWDVASGKPLGTDGHREKVFAVAVSPDGKTVATQRRYRAIMLTCVWIRPAWRFVRPSA